MEEQEIIVVTSNYRLGLFGFWFSEYITYDNQFHESDSGIKSGNQGILDQQMAMKWVHSYIYYFGGDPRRVTIGGMSAGGQESGNLSYLVVSSIFKKFSSKSIQTHLIVPSSFPYFSKAISISGPTGVPLKNEAQSTLFYENIARSG